MCLVTQDPTILTAEEDIVVYKILNYTKFLFGLFAISTSLYNGYRYKKNKVNPTIKLIPQCIDDEWVVDEGYHSYSGKPKSIALDHRTSRVAKFIIPKGAKYINEAQPYYSSNPEIVSSTIIYKGRVK